MIISLSIDSIIVSMEKNGRGKLLAVERITPWNMTNIDPGRDFLVGKKTSRNMGCRDDKKIDT